jgi:hypothetical protein
MCNGRPRLHVALNVDWKAHKPDFKAHLLGGPKFDEFSITSDHEIGRDIEI